MSDLTSTTTCRLCGKKFTGPSSLLIDPGGQSKQKNVALFFQQLYGHFQEAHPENMQALAMDQMQYGGLQMLRQFDTTDKDLEGHRDWLRWHIHQRTLKANVSDDGIDGLLDKITHEAHSIESMVVETRRALREMRDALQEPKEPPNPLA